MKEKLEVFLEKKWIWSAIAFAIPFVVCVIGYAVMGIYPFGERCILHVDMYHQYCPFFVELRDKLTSGGSLLYSWNLGLGSDFVSLFAYYLASPLNWLLILCPKGLVIEFMTITITIKIALGGLFFYWFLKEHFHLEDKNGKLSLNLVFPALVFSTAYAFSGFVAAYSWNIMWMDAVALAPLIILGLERLVKKQRPALYYVSLSIAIISNFYISMIICIFLVLYFVILFFEQKKGKLLACSNFALYSLLAGGTGAFLLIPEALVLSGTAAEGGSLPEKMEWYCNILEELTRLSIGTPAFTTGSGHWPNIYCGVFTVFLVILYVFNNRIKWTQKLPRIFMVILFVLSFANNYLDYFWHGLRFPNSLPGRQSFLFIFMMLVIGFDALKNRKGTRIWHVIVAVLLCAGWLVGGHYMSEAGKVELYSLVLSGIFVACYALCILLERVSGKYLYTIIRGFAFGLAIGEVILNFAITGFYSLSRTAYLAKADAYEVLLDMAEADANAGILPEEKIFYRVEDTERKTKNDDALYGYPSGTIFSSLMNIDVSHFYQSVYMEGGKNYYCYNGATPLVSSMLSVKYMLSDNNQGANSLRSLVGEFGGYYLYENTYCLPLGFMMTEEQIESWDNSTSAKISQINSLATVLGADTAMLNSAFLENDVTAGRTTITIEEDGFYYASYVSCGADNLDLSINGGPVTRFGKTTHRYLFEIGECKAGDTVTFSNSKSESIEFNVYKMDFDALDAAYETLSEQTMVLTKYTDTNIEGTIDVKEAGRLIFTIPNEEGWTLLVDGKPMLPEDFKETFISVHLEEGEHTISLSYVTPGLEMGAYISIFSVVIAVTMLIIGGKRGKKVN